MPDPYSSIATNHLISEIIIKKELQSQHPGIFHAGLLSRFIGTLKYKKAIILCYVLRLGCAFFTILRTESNMISGVVNEYNGLCSVEMFRLGL